MNRRDGEWPKPGPRGWRARVGEPRVACPVVALIEQSLNGRFPARAERRDALCSGEVVSGAAGQIQQRVDLRDGHRLRPVGNLDQLVAGLDVALRQHPKVEPRPVMRDHQRRDPRLVTRSPTR